MRFINIRLSVLTLLVATAAIAVSADWACLADDRGQSPSRSLTHIRAVIFDVGDVLRRNWVEEKLNDLARKYRIDPQLLLAVRDQYRDPADLGKTSDRKFWTDILTHVGVTVTEEDLAIARYFRPVPGTLDIARSLKGRYKLAILSNDSYESAAVGIALYGFDRVFDHIVISAYEGMKKPESLAFYLIPAEKLGVPPEDCLFIDDRPPNVDAARKVGMQAILFEGAPALRRALADMGITLER